jgi:hypothetical protein
MLLTYTFRPHCGLEVNSVSNRKEYQEYFLVRKGGRFLRLATLPTSCAEYLESGSLEILDPSRLFKDCFTL